MHGANDEIIPISHGRKLRDAARVDGLNEWQIFLFVYLPVMLPPASALFLFKFYAYDPSEAGLFNAILKALHLPTSQWMQSPEMTMTAMVERIERLLQEGLAPETLEVINESHHHAGHQPGFDGTGETHMRVRIVSGKFDGMSRLQRHRSRLGDHYPRQGHAGCT